MSGIGNECSGRRVLAAGPGVAVTQCGCGHVHLTLGHVSIQLRPDGVATLAKLLADASSVMKEPRAARPACEEVDWN